MCVHCEGTQTNGQRTFGEIVGLAPVVPVQPDPVECPRCGNSARQTLLEDCEGEEVCEDCFGDTSFQCEACGNVECNDDAYSDEETGETVCNACYDERYATCPCCNQEVRIGGADTETHDTWRGERHYHAECFWDEFTTCDGCGEIVNRDEAHYHERRDACFCRNCRPGDGECDAKAFRFEDTDSAGEVRSLRTYGVELETSECDDYEDLDGLTHFYAKDDGSIYGKEFVSEVLRGERGLQAIREFCGKASSFDVNKSCGYHLHIGFADLDDEAKLSIMLAYHYTQDAWFAMVDDERADNHFCRKFGWNPSVRSWADIRRISTDRYKWVNVCAFDEHGTIEVRLHGGTLHARTVTDWVVAHLRFVEHFAVYAPDDVRAMFRGAIKGDIAPQVEALRAAWSDDELYERMANKAQAESGTTFPLTVQS